MSLKYQTIPVTAYQQNCSIVWCDETMKGIVIDPGGDLHLLKQGIDALNIDVVNVVLTHGHFDHVGGAEALASFTQAPIIGPHEEDNFWIQGLPKQSEMFGCEPIAVFEPSRWLDDGDVIEFGHQTLAVLHTPGHTPGHVILFNQDAKIAFVGDVLFNGGIGRTDFPKSDHNALIHSIKTKLWPLGNDIRFVPGHGPESTFGAERKSNPFVADDMPIW